MSAVINSQLDSVQAREKLQDNLFVDMKITMR